MRVKRGVPSRKRRKRLLKQAKGFWGRRKNNIRRAKETLIRALAYSYRDRRQRKRDLRKIFVLLKTHLISVVTKDFSLEYMKL